MNGRRRIILTFCISTAAILLLAAAIIAVGTYLNIKYAGPHVPFPDPFAPDLEAKSYAMADTLAEMTEVQTETESETETTASEVTQKNFQTSTQKQQNSETSQAATETSAAPQTEAETEAPPAKRPSINETKGVFVPSVYNLSFPSKTNLSAAQLKKELDSIVENTKKAGLNSIYFQVRPTCDALYRSDYFPVSTVLNSSGELELDCLAYITEKCHREGISIHAWVNPLRVSASNMTVDQLPDGSPAKDPEYDVVSYNKKLYFDAGDPDVRQLIFDGIRELCTNYAIDGIVFDDYFYPGIVYETDSDGNRVAVPFDDAENFSTYGAAFSDVGDFRRYNINQLIEGVYRTVKSVDSSCQFGVSCFGIWKNVVDENGVRLTGGTESYYAYACDTLAWVKGGYVDYVAPQLYWTCDSTTSNYEILARWWGENVGNSRTKLLIAHASYKYDGSFDAAGKEMSKQLDIARELSGYGGSIFYSYNSIRDNLGGVRDEIFEYYNGAV